MLASVRPCRPHSPDCAPLHPGYGLFRATACRGLYLSGETGAARALNDELSEIIAAVGYDTPPIATKYMLKRIGVIGRNEHRLRMASAMPEERLDGVLEGAEAV